MEGSVARQNVITINDNNKDFIIIIVLPVLPLPLRPVSRSTISQVATAVHVAESMEAIPAFIIRFALHNAEGTQRTD